MPRACVVGYVSSNLFLFYFIYRNYNAQISKWHSTNCCIKPRLYCQFNINTRHLLTSDLQPYLTYFSKSFKSWKHSIHFLCIYIHQIEALKNKNSLNMASNIILKISHSLSIVIFETLVRLHSNSNALSIQCEAITMSNVSKKFIIIHILLSRPESVL